MAVRTAAVVFTLRAIIGIATVSETVHVEMQHHTDPEERKRHIGQEKTQVRPVFGEEKEERYHGEGAKNPTCRAGEETAPGVLYWCFHDPLPRHTPPGYPKRKSGALTHIKLGNG
jgi:hypothetical protein